MNDHLGRELVIGQLVCFASSPCILLTGKVARIEATFVTVQDVNAEDRLHLILPQNCVIVGDEPKQA